MYKIQKKKILFYLESYPYKKPEGGVELMDVYDQQGKLWKYMTYVNGEWNEEGQYCSHYAAIIWDLQSKHSTSYWFLQNIMSGLDPLDVSLKKLLAYGR